jgi:hypothetical protein
MNDITKYCACAKSKKAEEYAAAKGTKFPNPNSQKMLYSQLVKTSKFKTIITNVESKPTTLASIPNPSFT